MTFKKLTTLIAGLMFCICLLGNQVNQLAPEFIDGPSVQDVVPEFMDNDSAMDASDDVILMPLMQILPLLLFSLPFFLSRLYSQPIVITPKRPPTFN
jgi:hypothetical protein